MRNVQYRMDNDRRVRGNASMRAGARAAAVLAALLPCHFRTVSCSSAHEGTPSTAAEI